VLSGDWAFEITVRAKKRNKRTRIIDQIVSKVDQGNPNSRISEKEKWLEESIPPSHKRAFFEQ